MKRLVILVSLLLVVGVLSLVVVNPSKSSEAVNSQAHTEITRELSKELSSKASSYNITVVGDVMFDWSIKTAMSTEGPNYPLQHISPLIKDSDLSILNLETAIGTSGHKQDKLYTFQSPPASAKAMKDAGFDLVSLANNHAMDFGREGLYETIDLLKQADLNYIGAGKNENEAYRAYSDTINNHKIDILGFSQVLPAISWYANEDGGLASGYQQDRVIEHIKKSAANCDTTIVYLHWGTERTIQPSASQRNFAHTMIDAGADIIIGSHPHVLQGMEYYNGKPILYSLGNFLFPDYVDGDSADTVIAKIDVLMDNYEVTLIPAVIHDSTVTLADKQNAARITDKMIYRSNLISQSSNFAVSEVKGNQSLTIATAGQ
ncbi:CapA family protein [Guptibacillus algicola]|uniref:CapA family protein n=1 Tax=Guptibacillus algicola TaxID=225844 RepID=UPI001CD630BF|nr:CapA family protein [Alkalihalobacillus algicola]MCA0987590.1 CapA family protein [Alkalihalobacillus algicola]